MSPPTKIDTNSCRLRIRKALETLREEVDKAMAKKEKGPDWHFNMVLAETSKYLHDKGVQDGIVATGDLDSCMKGSGFSSFLRNVPDRKSLFTAYNALPSMASELNSQLLWQDLNLHYMLKGQVL